MLSIARVTSPMMEVMQSFVFGRWSLVPALAPVLMMLSLSSLSACQKEASVAPIATRSCEGMCGHGTKCVEDTCVIDWGQGVCIKPEDAVCEEPERPEWTQCPLAHAALPPFRTINDKKIPRFNKKQTRVQSFDGGSERPDEYAMKQQIELMITELESCLAIVACYEGKDPGGGEIEFVMRLKPDGKVTSVSASSSPNYAKWGATQCARKVIYEHTFEPYDGEAMALEYTMIIE